MNTCRLPSRRKTSAVGGAGSCAFRAGANVPFFMAGRITVAASAGISLINRSMKPRPFERSPKRKNTGDALAALINDSVHVRQFVLVFASNILVIASDAILDKHNTTSDILRAYCKLYRD